MLNIKRILKDDRLLRATTGLNRKAFESLLIDFTQLYEEQNESGSKTRIRTTGGGRKSKLKTLKEKLFYILFYFECYPTFDLAAVFFDFDRSQANRWVHRLQGILEMVLGEKKVLPMRKIKSIDEFVEHFPKVKEVIIDVTGRL